MATNKYTNPDHKPPSVPDAAGLVGIDEDGKAHWFGGAVSDPTLYVVPAGSNVCNRIELPAEGTESGSQIYTLTDWKEYIETHQAGWHLWVDDKDLTELLEDSIGDADGL